MSKHIMIVDDSATMRQMVSITLRDAGYEVLEAGDGVEALLQLENEYIDMLITDLNMPRLDGVGLIANVRRSSGRRFMPIVMLTTESDDRLKSSAKRAGASAWLTKPFRPEPLLGLVQTVLSQPPCRDSQSPQPFSQKGVLTCRCNSLGVQLFSRQLRSGGGNGARQPHVREWHCHHNLPALHVNMDLSLQLAQPRVERQPKGDQS